MREQSYELGQGRQRQEERTTKGLLLRTSKGDIRWIKMMQGLLRRAWRARFLKCVSDRLKPQ